MTPTLHTQRPPPSTPNTHPPELTMKCLLTTARAVHNTGENAFSTSTNKGRICSFNTICGVSQRLYFAPGTALGTRTTGNLGPTIRSHFSGEAAHELLNHSSTSHVQHVHKGNSTQVNYLSGQGGVELTGVQYSTMG